MIVSKYPVLMLVSRFFLSITEIWDSPTNPDIITKLPTSFHDNIGFLLTNIYYQAKESQNNNSCRH